MAYSKNESFELKVKDTKGRRNQGAFFEQKAPNKMMPILNEIIGKDVFIPKTKNHRFTKTQWCLILEILVKYYTYERNEYYYMNKLHATTNL